MGKPEREDSGKKQADSEEMPISLLGSRIVENEVTSHEPHCRVYIKTWVNFRPKKTNVVCLH